MNAIQLDELPKGAILEKYTVKGARTDCYFIDLPKHITQAQFIEAFYTTRLFKVERLILALIARRPSTDMQAKQLGLGELKNFAAWSVEEQTQDQLLLCDFLGKTRSWLMSVSRDGDKGTGLYFGSAVIPKHDHTSGETKFGMAFNALGGFHHAYSKALLKAACLRLLG